MEKKRGPRAKIFDALQLCCKASMARYVVCLFVVVCHGRRRIVHAYTFSVPSKGIFTILMKRY